MSRITAPVSKLTRTIGSNASNLLSNGSKSAASLTRKPDLGDHHLTESHDQTTRSLTTPAHRPQPTPNPLRTMPLMQTFTTSSAPRAQADTSTIDFFRLPASASLYSAAAVPTLRVPLLPDSFTLFHEPETLDPPLPTAEISVVAANPDTVMAVSPLTEVEGMGADGIELGFVHGLGEGKKGEEDGGMIRDLWKGLLEDVFGEEKKGKTV